MRLREEPGQRGVAYLLVLAGMFRSIDFADAARGPDRIVPEGEIRPSMTRRPAG